MDLAGGLTYVGLKQEVRTGFVAQGQPMGREDADLDTLSSDEE